MSGLGPDPGAPGGELPPNPADPGLPAGDAAPLPADGQPQVPGEDDVYLWRWRGEERPVPRAMVDSLGQAIGAPSGEALINWSQIGRDHQYHRERLQAEMAAERERMARERRELELRERRISMFMNQQDFNRQDAPLGVPPATAYPYAPPTAPAPGGYPAYPSPYLPGGGVPSGYPANGMTPTPGYPQAGLPYGVQPGSVFAQIAMLPHQLAAWQNEVRTEVRRAMSGIQAREIERVAREEQAALDRLAEQFVARLKEDGYEIPENYGPQELIEECNNLGLSDNSHLPWLDAFEMVAARRFWRHSYRVGQARMTADLEANRGKTIRVPAGTRPAGTPPPGPPAPAAPAGSLEARVQAARALGAGITMREATTPA